MKNIFIEEFNPTPTDVAVCGSMFHTELLKDIIVSLTNVGLTVSKPEMTESIVDWSKFSDDEIIDRIFTKFCLGK